MFENAKLNELKRAGFDVDQEYGIQADDESEMECYRIAWREGFMTLLEMKDEVPVLHVEWYLYDVKYLPAYYILKGIFGPKVVIIDSFDCGHLVNWMRGESWGGTSGYTLLARIAQHNQRFNTPNSDLIDGLIAQCEVRDEA